MERSERLRSFWNQYCKRGYSAVCSLLWFKRIFKTWKDVLIPQPGERILEGGTGSGGMFQPIVEKVQPSTIVAVDFSEEMLKEAQKTARRLLRRDKSLICRIINLIRRALCRPHRPLNDITFHFENVDLTRLFPWPDHYFGAETFSFLISYLLNCEREHLFREAYRTLKPGGYVYASTCLEGWNFAKVIRKGILKEMLLNSVNLFRALPVASCATGMDQFKREGIFSYPREGEIPSLLMEIGFTEIYTIEPFEKVEIVRAQKPLS